jgi:hypothetical protein
VNEAVDLLEEDPDGDNDICSLHIEYIDITDKVVLNNTFNQIMKAKYLQASDNQ